MRIFLAAHGYLTSKTEKVIGKNILISYNDPAKIDHVIRIRKEMLHSENKKRRLSRNSKES